MSFVEGSYIDLPNIFLVYSPQRWKNFEWQQNSLGSHQICPTSSPNESSNKIIWAFNTEYQIAVRDRANLFMVNETNNLINQQLLPSTNTYSFKPSYVVFKGIYSTQNLFEIFLYEALCELNFPKNQSVQHIKIKYM